MRILISTSSGDVIGGVETYLRALLPLLHARGHELALLCEAESRAGGPPIAEDSSLAARISVERGGERAALEQARRFAPEVVYQHGVIGASLEEALLELAPAVLFEHTYRGTCISGMKRFAVPRMSPCSRRLGPACLLLYPVRRCGGRSPLTMWREYAAQTARGALLPRYRRVVVASEHMAREVERHGGAPRVIGGLLTWPLRPEAPEPRAQTGRVLMASRLNVEKGVRPLVQAVDEAARSLGRPLALRFAGSGPDEPWLRARAATARSRVECLGWLSPEALRAEMEQADVLAVPSLLPEPFGLAGIEAAAVGLPAVAYAAGGIPSWLEAGVGGELAGQFGSVPALADALVRVLRDPERWQSLRVGAWRSAHRFSGDAHAQALEEVLRDAAGPGPLTATAGR